MTGLVLRRAAVRPGVEADLFVVNGRFSSSRPPAGSEVVDLAGRPVLPAFTDHHVHLLALAASWTSVDLAPSALDAEGGLAPALRAGRARQPDPWLRATGYDVAASGRLDRSRLDQIDVGPVRIQDRTGIQWILDSRALDAVLPDDPAEWPDGVERDGAGRPTGVLVRLDRWLRERVVTAGPDLGATTRWLASRGVTTVTDAGADNETEELALLAAAAIPQRLVAMTSDAEITAPPGVELGPVKVLLDDDRLPTLDQLTERIERAHRSGRAVAVHCVTEVQVVLALAAGLRGTDRVEHGSHIPDALLAELARAGPTVVVQPGLVATRGDRYLQDHPPAEHRALHRLGSLLRAGLPVAASSDAPYGPADPWITVSAAVQRRTARGRTMGAADAVDAMTAVGLLAGDPHAPARRHTVAPGQPADLIVLDDGWDQLPHRPSVLATLRAGDPIAGRLPS